MKSTLRLSLAALLAALALAAAGLGAGGGGSADSGAPGTPGLRPARGGAPAGEVRQGLALAFLQGGRPAVQGPARRAGPLARVGPGPLHSDPPPFAHVDAARQGAAARIPPLLRPSFARRLAAARDGTLSARSTGVPPPCSA